eukprot:TRINITY_DN11840_c0_g2_i2.p1 TRINITY_DN11840_c0_g2~~TRINITY_DN11840_c0_g2_i2.p1  ORF type:complete len:573 (-),score=27.91 TRINITY_DN11840_c0_g2_i2:197-1915(-)
MSLNGFEGPASWKFVGTCIALLILVSDAARPRELDLNCVVSGNTCSVRDLPSRQVTCTANTPTCCCSYGGGNCSVNAVLDSSHCVAGNTTKQVISLPCWWQEEPRSYWITRAVIRLALISAVCLGALMCVAYRFRRQLDRLSMFVLTFVAYFGGLLHYTVIIPEAYSFATSLHRSAADSGSLIGSAFLFPAMVMIATRPCHSSSLACVRVLCAVNFVVRCLGALVFFLGADPAMARQFSLNARYYICLVGRMLGGACQGFSPLFVCAAKQMTPLADQVRLGSIVKAAATLGLGLGPLTSNLVNYHIALSTTIEERTANPFLALVVLNLCFFILTWLIFPTRPDLSEDFQRAVIVDQGTETNETSERRGNATPKLDVHFHQQALWKSAIVLDCERSFTLASLEAGVAFILEYYVGWTTEAAGYACSIMCIAVVPFLFIQFSLGDDARRDMLTLRACGVCAVALPLLLGFTRVTNNQTVMLLIFILMFLVACIAGGICNGYAYKVSARSGHFTVSNFLIASGFLNGASRYIAPLASRWLLQNYGVSAYAAMLVISGVVGVIALLPFRGMPSFDF